MHPPCRFPLRSTLSQRLVLAIYAGAFLASCTTEIDDFPPYTDADAQNLDGWELYEATTQLSRVDGMRGFLVSRNGVLVVEEYFNAVGPDSVMDVRSVTKSFTSSLIGIAISAGFIESVDDTLGDYLVPDVVDVLDADKAAISLHHLLTMSAGFQWRQGRLGSDFSDWYLSDDHVQYVLDKPFVAEPGSTFAYSDGMAHLLSVVLTEATGMNADEFAAEHLFAHLDIPARNWLRGNRGYNFGGVRLQISLRDMLKFGELYLNHGRVGETQVVPEAWVRQSTQAHLSTGAYSPFGPEYGYLWWIGEGAPYDFYFANGYGGQFIVVVPETRMVVVTQCQPSGYTRDEAETHWYTILSTVVERVIPAAR
ncbi:MAG: serine hydrolase [Gemmatimonadota bacterium]|nr:MAG: serine hydrolase [Gemmatimonadota bacterium]